MDLVLSEIGMVPVVLQVGVPDQVSPFHQLVVLGAGEGMPVEGLDDLQPCCPPHISGGPQRIGIEPNALGVPEPIQPAMAYGLT